jgi:regulator of protease activity HflC (stomatin/prohibitin superfamily)
LVLTLESSMVLEVVLGTLAVGGTWFVMSARVIRQFERGVVLRLGRVQQPPRAPGLTVIRAARRSPA